MNNKNEPIIFPKKEKRFESLIIVIFTLIAIAVCILIVARNFSPAEPNVGTDIPFDVGKIETQTDEDGNVVAGPVGQVKLVRKPGVYNFLFVGYDKAAGLTDVNMLAQFDTNTGAINIIQMPRDTYSRYNSKEGSYHKINGALGYFDRQLEDFATFLEKNLCIKIDFYGSIDLVAFRNIVDISGGVELYVPRDMKYEDPAQNLYIDLKEGFQKLDGKKAEQFVRFRSGWATADIGRTDAQKLFITAFMKKFVNSINLETVTQICTQMIKHVNTNLTLKEYIYFAEKVLSIDLDKLTMLTLPGSSVREYETRGTWYYVLSKTAMLDAINTYINVYDQDIPESIFDPNKMFTNPDVDYMMKIYNTDSQTNIYVGNEVDGEGIYIPPTKDKPVVNTPPDMGSTDTDSADTDSADTDSVDTDTPDTELPVDPAETGNTDIADDTSDDEF